MNRYAWSRSSPQAKKHEISWSILNFIMFNPFSSMEVVKHLAKFIAGIWQIHPFCERNIRATAVFIIKYMCSFGFQINNEAFEKHSWYFRNALVRANYNELQHGIHATTLFLERFFSNLLLNSNYELKNRTMHVDYREKNTFTFLSSSKSEKNPP